MKLGLADLRSPLQEVLSSIVCKQLLNQLRGITSAQAVRLFEKIAFDVGKTQTGEARWQLDSGYRGMGSGKPYEGAENSLVIWLLPMVTRQALL